MYFHFSFQKDSISAILISNKKNVNFQDIVKSLLKLLFDVTDKLPHATDNINNIIVDFTQMQHICCLILSIIKINMLNHFRTDITEKKFCIYISLHAPIDSFLGVYQKKLYLEFFPFLAHEILPFQTFFFQKVSIPNFCCSKLWASCDISLESS